jgi:hypothetical protein
MGPGPIIASWSMCACPPGAGRSTPGPSGHLAVYCRPKGCARCVTAAPRHGRPALTALTALDGPAGPGTSRGQDPVLSQSICRDRSRACSTCAYATSNRRAIESQSVRLSANSLRPERRSDDGQMILQVILADQEPRSDLLFCGAPLRNRTVDLLLTIDNQQVPVTAVEALNWPFAGSHELSQAAASAR